MTSRWDTNIFAKPDIIKRPAATKIRSVLDSHGIPDEFSRDARTKIYVIAKNNVCEYISLVHSTGETILAPSCPNAPRHDLYRKLIELEILCEGIYTLESV